MICARQIFFHLALMLLALALLTTTLFISQPVEFPERRINMGYPIHFYTLDFGSTNTSMGGAPDEFLRSRKFNYLSSWEERSQFSLPSFVVSYIIIFLGIECTILVFHRVKQLGRKE